MRAFLDFEASSLAKESYPIEIAWAWEDGREETHLIRPAPGWTDWDERAAVIHGIARSELLSLGASHVEIAHRVVDSLVGHLVYASSPSWDGKWLSVLLRSAGLPRHALRLRDTDEAQLEAARSGLQRRLPEDGLDATAAELIRRVRAADEGPIAHRALPDAAHELWLWREIGKEARAFRL